MTIATKEKKYTENEIKIMLQSSNYAVERGIAAIYKYQTDTEKDHGETISRNNVGFSAFHASRASYYARWINSGKHLSGDHIEKGRRIILHYVKQLTKISNNEI